ncbi:IS1 family transposase, partial [Escherichia coli]
ITIDDCWKGWAILLRQKQKKLIMLPSETMIWQPEFTDKTLSRKPGAVQSFSKSVELHDKVIGHYLNIKHYQ